MGTETTIKISQQNKKLVVFFLQQSRLSTAQNHAHQQCAELCSTFLWSLMEGCKAPLINSIHASVELDQQWRNIDMLNNSQAHQYIPCITKQNINKWDTGQHSSRKYLIRQRTFLLSCGLKCFLYHLIRNNTGWKTIWLKLFDHWWVQL